MGQQQILLIVLSVILVGIAIAVGITMFQSQAEQSNVDAIIADLNNLGATAYQYYMKPASMGGGGSDYRGFDTYFDSLPTGMKGNENAAYKVAAIADGTNPVTTVTILAQSKFDENNYRGVEVDDKGAMTILDSDAAKTEWDK